MVAGTLADFVHANFGVPSPGAVNDKLRAFFSKVYTSDGVPEGSVTAPIGSFCFDQTNGNMYAKQTGSGNTGWTPWAGAGVTPTTHKVTGGNLYGVGDRALERLITRSINQARDWLTWCKGTTSLTPWVTEVGWPTRGSVHGVDAERWQALGDALYSWGDAELINMVYWVARTGTPASTELLQAYSASVAALDTKYLPAEIIEKHPTLSTAKRGINWPEGYYGFTVGTASTDVAGGSNLVGYTFGTTYNYGSLANWQYLAAQGHKVVRLHFRLERLFSGASGTSATINATEVARIISTLDDMTTAGLQAILCASNFGLYYLDVAGTATAQYLGSAGFTQAQFVAMWTALSTAFKGHAAVLGYDLMGEPAGATTLAVWQAASQAALVAIRANADTHLILVEGWGFSGMATWIQTNGAVGWITDSANNFAYNAHWYVGDTGGAYTGATTLDSYCATAETALVLQTAEPGLVLPNKIETHAAHLSVSTVTLASGSIYAICFTAPITHTVTKLKMWEGNGTTAGLTAARMAIGSLTTDDQILTYLAETASDTGLFAASFTSYERNLDNARGGPTSFTFVQGERYALIAFAAGSTPKVVGTPFVVASISLDLHPHNCFVALTAQSDLPAPGSTTAHASFSNCLARLYISAS